MSHSTHISEHVERLQVEIREMNLQHTIRELVREKVETRLLLEWHFGGRRSMGYPPPSMWQVAPDFVKELLGLDSN